MRDGEIEYCCECDQATGHSGRLEDSLFTIYGEGPYCDECWEDVPEERRGDGVVTEL